MIKGEDWVIQRLQTSKCFSPLQSAPRGELNKSERESLSDENEGESNGNPTLKGVPSP